MLHKRNLLICVVAVAFCLVGIESAKACDDWYSVVDCYEDYNGNLWVCWWDCYDCCFIWVCLEGSWSFDTTQDGIGSNAQTGNIIIWEWDLDNDGSYDDSIGETLGFTPVLSSTSLLVYDSPWRSGPGGTAPPPKGRTCFVADTPALVNGRNVQISKVTASQTINEVQEHEGTFLCRNILLESGNTIGVVDAHCFMADAGQWVPAQDLHAGLRLKTLTGSVGIKSISTRTYTGKVYNLKIAGSDQYMVGKDSVIVRDY